MTKEKVYKYVGCNGTITSEVLLPGISNLPYVRLIADSGCMLQRGNIKHKIVLVPEHEVELWTEVEG
jgi:hypothetical protein